MEIVLVVLGSLRSQVGMTTMTTATAKTKYRDLSTTQWAIRPPIAFVEMTFVQEAASLRMLPEFGGEEAGEAMVLADAGEVGSSKGCGVVGEGGDAEVGEDAEGEI